ncbi:MAG: metallophosphoesterase [Megasphaera sp.]|jgi:rubrerythrin/predicted phosphodiesterase|nr:metallophosphoesterase [Megasphaera sp.]MCH4187393.1 metallophosphoesterase [Megasphaera sp.]MCH4217575.1 metallophosphoesterase [Megasphaera sp.]
MAIQKIQQDIVSLGKVHSFTVIGDPGCEGLGLTNMEVYANALAAAEQDDFILVVGDFVPAGTDTFYQDITELTNAISEQDVYALRGNHDTGTYDDHFGRHNYAISCTDFTIVVLDNALRTFEDEGLQLLGRVLADPAVQHVLIAFHIPIPNHFTGNAVKPEEFQRLRDVYLPYRHKVNYFICGHVHSRFIDTVDGIPFICTGGGGAMIEDVSDNIRAADVNYHVIKFFCHDGVLQYDIVDLQHSLYPREKTNPIVRHHLLAAIQNELMAHLQYRMYAERAQRRGYTNIANLFEAMAESEYRHARNFFAVYDKGEAFGKTISSFLATEKYGLNHLYTMMEGYAKEQHMPLTRQAFSAAMAAEDVHIGLQQQIEKDSDFDAFDKQTFYVCSVCGYLMPGNKKAPRCPVCGAPERVYIEFTTK